MLNVKKEQKGNTLIVRIIGSIEESTNLDQLIGPPPAELHVYCKEIPRINSLGVRAWIRYFQAARTKGTVIKLFECSTAVIEQINFIANFAAGIEVDSLCVPFSCTSCHTELIGIFKTTDLKKMKLKLPELKCTKCGNKAIFDDIPEEYFGFLLRE